MQNKRGHIETDEGVMVIETLNKCNIPCYKPWITGCRRNINSEIDVPVDCGYYGI